MAKNRKSTEQLPALKFGAENAVLGAAGLVCLVAGYSLLAQGSITAAPILLVVAYLVLLPMAIIR